MNNYLGKASGKLTVTKFLLGILFFTLSLTANDFDINSSISKSKVYQNEPFQLTLSVSGSDRDLYKSIQKPDLNKNFKIISTSQSSSFSYQNGISNRLRRYQFQLIPKDSGIFIIDPFKITYKGRVFSTKPLRLVVREGTINQPQPTQQPFRQRIAPTNQSIQRQFSRGRCIDH